MGRLQDIVAFITGAAASMRKAIAKFFAKEGVKVAVVDPVTDIYEESGSNRQNKSKCKVERNDCRG